MKTAHLHPEARLEAGFALDWYAQRSRRVAEDFSSELDYLFATVIATPQRFAAYIYQTKRAVFSNFPYSIIFRETSDEIQIIAVAHGKRRPGYWHDRQFK